MKKLLFLLIGITSIQISANAQCTNSANKQVEMTCFSVSTSTGVDSILLGKTVNMLVVLTNDVSGTSAYIPTGNAVFNIALPPHVAYDSTFISTTGVFTVTNFTSTNVTISNSNGNWIKGEDDLFEFAIEGISVYKATSNNVTANASLSATSTCSEPYTSNNSSTTKVSVYAAAPQSVKLISLDAKAENEGVNVSWKTAQEIDMAEYVVLRSQDALVFSTAGVVKADNKSGSYSFMDTKAFEGENYYKLQSVSNDGTTEMSSIISVSNEKGNSVSVFPIPTRSNSVELKNIKGNVESMTLVNATGGRSIAVSHSATSNGVAVKIPSGTIAGVYLLNIMTDAGKVVKRIVVE